MGLTRLQKVKGYKITPLIICSNKEDESLAKKYKFDTVFYKNDPLGEKKNFGLQEALKRDFDYLMEINSDDVVKNELLEIYRDPIERKVPFFGLQNFAFVDSPTGNVRHYITKTLFGIGRMYHKDLLKVVSTCQEVEPLDSFIASSGVMNRGVRQNLAVDTANELAKCGLVKKIKGVTNKLWDDKANSGMDNHSEWVYSFHGVKAERILTDEPLAMDIKSDVNIWKFNKNIGQDYGLNQLLEGLTKKEQCAIRELQMQPVSL